MILGVEYVGRGEAIPYLNSEASAGAWVIIAMWNVTVVMEKMTARGWGIPRWKGARSLATRGWLEVGVYLCGVGGVYPRCHTKLTSAEPSLASEFAVSCICSYLSRRSPLLSLPSFLPSLL